MKKVLSIAICLLMVISLLSGCELPKKNTVSSNESNTSTVSKSNDSSLSFLKKGDQEIIDKLGYLTHHKEVKKDELEWSFNSKTKTLIISGEGPMKDYLDDDPAWWKHANEVEKIVVNDKVTTIGDYAFYRFENVSSVSLPSTIEYIGENAFGYCYEISSIPFTDSLNEIAAYAFQEVKTHKPLIIPEGIEIIAKDAFHAGDFNYISIPISAYFIEEEAFSNCGSIERFDVQENNPNYASPDGVLYSKDGKIMYTYPIEKKDVTYEIPDSVETIASYCLDVNYYLAHLKIPASVKVIKGTQFGCLYALEDIVVDEKNTNFKIDNNGLLSMDGKIFYTYPKMNKSLTKYVLPSTVETVEFRAFFECDSFKKIYLQEGVTKLELGALTDTATTIYLPKSIKEIDYYTILNDNPMIINYAGTKEEWDKIVADNELDLNGNMPNGFKVNYEIDYTKECES